LEPVAHVSLDKRLDGIPVPNVRRPAALIIGGLEVTYIMAKVGGRWVLNKMRIRNPNRNGYLATLATHGATVLRDIYVPRSGTLDIPKPEAGWGATYDLVLARAD
jgi:hypothetical protein